MPFTIDKRTIVVAGLPVNIYSGLRHGHATNIPVAVVFMLHGRTGSANRIDSKARLLLNELYDKPHASSKDKLEVIVVTFDQRNHGRRLVDADENQTWKEGNEHHAFDMFTIYTGTAKDVSFLIDVLPSYLYPSEERIISEWIVSGISLGGHVAWLVLKDDPRVNIGIPIIGCADYLTLITRRAEHQLVPVAPPYFPKSFVSLVRRTDPAASTPFSSSDPSNPYLGKKVLVQCGAEDRLVPYSDSKHFIEKLQVGNGVKKVVIEDGVGHECTDSMVANMADFIRKEALL